MQYTDYYYLHKSNIFVTITILLWLFYICDNNYFARPSRTIKNTRRIIFNPIGYVNSIYMNANIYADSFTFFFNNIYFNWNSIYVSDIPLRWILRLLN